MSGFLSDLFFFMLLIIKKISYKRHINVRLYVRCPRAVIYAIKSLRKHMQTADTQTADNICKKNGKQVQ